MEKYLVLAELGENAEGGFGVQEGYLCIMSTGNRCLIDESAASCLGSGELADYIICLEGDVMDHATATIFFNSLSDRALGTGGFKELYLHTANVEHSYTHLLCGDF